MRAMVFLLTASSLTTGLFPIAAQAQSSKRPSQVIPATTEAYRMLAKYPEINGTIIDVGADQITLRVAYKHQVLANGQTSVNQINQSLAQLKRAKMAAMTPSNSRRRPNLGQAANQAQATINRNIKMVEDWIDYVLPLDPGVSIRKVSRGVEFDDKGFPKSQSGAGKGGPGFEANRSDLVAGVDVRVKLLHVYGPAKTSTTPKFIGAEVVPSSPVPSYAPRVGRIIFITDEFGSPVLRRR